MHPNKLFAVLLLPLAAIDPAMAFEIVTPWKGEVELGAVATSGNTEAQSLKARASVIHEWEQWRQTAKLEALNTSDAVRTTAERYLVSVKTDYRFDEFSYLFGLVQYENDRFAGYDYRVSESIGYGRRVIHQPDLTLDLELGPGARQTKPIGAAEANNELTVLAAGNLVWKLSGTAAFSENFSVEWGEDSTISRSVSALTAQVLDGLAMKLSFAARHVSTVSLPAKNLDTEIAVTLVYGF